MALRDIILARIERMLRLTFAENEAEALDVLEIKSDEELLSWYDRFRDLELVARRPAPDDGRRYRVDPAGFY